MGPENVTEPRRLATGVVDVEFGRNVTYIEPVNLYGCSIGDDTFIGPFVEVQKQTQIGKRCRIQSHTFICELVEIGDDCFIGHGVMFINDSFRSGGPARGDRSLWQETRIGDRVSIGSNATIMPVDICNDVIVGAGAVVVASIRESGTYVGNPAQRIRKK